MDAASRRLKELRKHCPRRVHAGSRQGRSESVNGRPSRGVKAELISVDQLHRTVAVRARELERKKDRASLSRLHRFRRPSAPIPKSSASQSARYSPQGRVPSPLERKITGHGLERLPQMREFLCQVAKRLPSTPALGSEARHDLLENDVAPLFYDRNALGIPRGWLANMKASMTKLSPSSALRGWLLSMPSVSMSRLPIGSCVWMAKRAMYCP